MFWVPSPVAALSAPATQPSMGPCRCIFKEFLTNLREVHVHALFTSIFFFPPPPPLPPDWSQSRTYQRLFLFSEDLLLSGRYLVRFRVNLLLLLLPFLTFDEFFFFLISPSSPAVPCVSPITAYPPVSKRRFATSYRQSVAASRQQCFPACLSKTPLFIHVISALSHCHADCCRRHAALYSRRHTALHSHDDCAASNS